MGPFTAHYWRQELAMGKDCKGYRLNHWSLQSNYMKSMGQKIHSVFLFCHLNSILVLKSFLSLSCILRLSNVIYVTGLFHVCEFKHNLHVLSVFSQEHWCFLRIAFKGQTFKFKALQFSLSLVPQGQDLCEQLCLAWRPEASGYCQMTSSCVPPPRRRLYRIYTPYLHTLWYLSLY